MSETAPTAEMPFVHGDDPLIDLAMQPWRFAEAAHDLYLTWWHRWARLCVCPSYPPRPHEAAQQLAVPDPIEANREDLFA